MLCWVVAHCVVTVSVILEFCVGAGSDVIYCLDKFSRHFRINKAQYKEVYSLIERDIKKYNKQEFSRIKTKHYKLAALR